MPSLLLALWLTAFSLLSPSDSSEGVSSFDDSRALLEQQAPELNSEVLDLALLAASCARSRGIPKNDLLTVIDYSLPSTEVRLWVFDLAEERLVGRHLVAHGVNTGENMALHFSNVSGSKQSSLGLFLTAEVYQGRNGYSLRLDGLEPGVNDLARPRAIVMHGAWYVSPEFAAEHGRLGRSWGCPALSREAARGVIDTIRDGSLLFIYSSDREWLEGSTFLGQCRLE